jgi:hypothetical protein
MKTIFHVNYSTKDYPIQRLTHCKMFAKLRDAKLFVHDSAGYYQIIRQTWVTNWDAKNETIEEGKND